MEGWAGEVGWIDEEKIKRWTSARCMARKSATVDTCEGRVCTARAAKHGQAAYDAGWEERPGWGEGRGMRRRTVMFWK